MKIDPKFRPELVISRDETRYNLTDPYLDADAKSLVATNGHSLVAVPAEVAEGEASRYIDRNLLRAARRWTRAEFGPNTPLEISGDTVANGGPTWPTLQGRGPGFPKWQEVVPTKAPGQPGTVTIGIDPKLLLSIAEALGADVERPHHAQVLVTIDLGDLGAPFLVRRGREPEAFGALMPVSFTTSELPGSQGEVPENAHGVWFVPPEEPK